MHAATLFVLGFIAAAAAAAAPGYAITGAESLTATELGAASAAERLVTVEGDITLRSDVGSSLTQLDQQVVGAVGLPGFTTVDDARLPGQVGDTRLDLTYREGVCDRLTVTGSCPTQAGDVTLAADMAGLLKVKIGDTLTFACRFVKAPVKLHLVGIYRPTDPTDPYWGVSATAENGTVSGARFQLGTAFTPEATLVTASPSQIHATFDVMATADAVKAKNPEYLAQNYEKAIAPLGTRNLNLSSKFRVYADRTLAQTNLIFLGVVAGTVQLLVLVWFALALAVRQTSETRRPDVALMKLRGSGRSALWRLSAGQAAVPIVLGGLVGLAAGGLGVRLWAGPIADPTVAPVGLYGTLVAAAAAVLIAVASALFAERRMLAEPVGDLARRVPARQRGWRAGVLDAAVIALALAAAFELRSSAVATNQFRGLDVLAPTLVALAVGVVAAWLVPRFALMVSTPALRVGRLGVGLSAVHLARRTALPRVLTMFTLAVAVATGSVLAWDISTRAQQERAVVEVGADRVLTVQTTTPSALLEAVRSVDPEGRYAMAVVRTLNGTPTLAVDSGRLAAIVPWYPSYGLPDWPTVARTLRAGASPPTVFHSGPMTVDATWTPTNAAARASLTAVIEQPGGVAGTVDFGQLRTARSTYQATLTGCQPQCRLIGFRLTGSAKLIGSSLLLRSFTVGGTPVVDQASFADRSHWRTSVVQGDELPLITTGTDGLSLTVDLVQSNTATIVFPVYVRDAQTPVPTYAAGDIPPESRIGAATVQAPGAGPVPATIVGTAALLPRVGGNGRLIDLATIVELGSESGRFEVWLAPRTPDSVVQALTAHGLSIVDDDSIDARLGDLRSQGPPIALRYMLAVALVGLVLAVGAFGVAAAVERPTRADELASLRRQGLRPAVVRTVGYGGYLAFVLVAVGLGVLTSLLATRFIIGPPRVYGDGWSVLAVPEARQSTLGIIVAVLILATGSVAALAARRLVRLVRAGGPVR